MRRERAEAAIVGVALIAVVGALAFSFVLAVSYGVIWMLK